MSFSTCKFIKRIAEFVPAENSENVPDNTRGIYALLKETKGGHFNVIYVGMSGYSKTSGIYSRLKSHRQTKRLKDQFTHFTIFEVHDNITGPEIREIEGLFRHMYRKDKGANRFNRQLCHKPFHKPKILVSKAKIKQAQWGNKKSEQ